MRTQHRVRNAIDRRDDLKRFVFRGREDKLAEVARRFPQLLAGDVLDVGCDARFLEPNIQGHYAGVDIRGRPDLFVDLESDLPLRTRSFDTVLAFDILEHLNRIHTAFDELCRVSRTHVIIGLPNLYEWRFRLMFLLGQGLGEKYGLQAKPPEDCHRWVFGLREAREFVRRRALENGFKLAEECLGYYRYQRPAARILMAMGWLAAPRASYLFASHYVAVVRRNHGRESQWRGDEIT